MVSKNNPRKLAGRSQKTLAHHIVKSLVSVAPQQRSGQAVHHRHTSHGFLMLLLLVTGVLLFSNLGALKAYGVMQSGSHTVTVNVAGAPPSIGADITFPTNNSMTKSPQVEVKGTCQADTLVATYNNGTFAGSSMCTSDSDYAITIQLVSGANVLQSQDYDGLNQPGPSTAQVLITLEEEIQTIPPTEETAAPIATTPADIEKDPNPPVVPTVLQPTQNPCYDVRDQDMSSSPSPIIRIACITRNIFAGQTLELPVKVQGGIAPYGLTIDWGDGQTDLKSVTNTVYHTYQHTYQNAGDLNIKLNTTDANGVKSFIQAVVEVNGTPAAPGATFASVGRNFDTIWTNAPVPLYFAAVALVLGFWVGDIFQRYFAVKRGTRRLNPHKNLHI